MLCTFWLANVLRATTACNFSSLIWPAGSAPAALASLLFDPPEPQINGKTQCFATFLPFRASVSAFFWLFLFSDLLSSTFSLFSLPLPCSAFHLSILSEVWLLNFLRWYFYGISMIFLCDFSGISMIFHLDFYDISMGFLWGFNRMSMGFPLGDFLGFLWYFYGISLYWITVWYLWDFHGGSLEFLWDFKGVSMGFPLDVNQISMGSLWYFYDFSMGFLWEFC